MQHAICEGITSSQPACGTGVRTQSSMAKLEVGSSAPDACLRAYAACCEQHAASWRSIDDRFPNKASVLDGMYHEYLLIR